MPSPFLGMDPFLEHPVFFPGFHHSFVVYLSEALQPRLPATYSAEINRRLWVDTIERPPQIPPLQPGNRSTAGHRTAEQPIEITVLPEERHEIYLDIRVASEGKERVVTTIELLSPTNKTSGPRGRSLYLQKQQEVLDSDVHLVEIDLLRGGLHTTAVPLDRLLRKAPPFDYHVCVHHFDQLGKFFVYTVSMPQCLPDIAIPLLPGDGPIKISLQAVFDRSYDTGPYRRRVLYVPSRIVPPLAPEQLAWVTNVLREKGLLATEPPPPRPT